MPTFLAGEVFLGDLVFGPGALAASPATGAAAGEVVTVEVAEFFELFFFGLAVPSALFFPACLVVLEPVLV
jgi:hypothetical protein